MRQSPARNEAPEPDAWLPILDLTGELELLNLEEGRGDLDRELRELEKTFWSTAPTGLEDAVAKVAPLTEPGPTPVAAPIPVAAPTPAPVAEPLVPGVAKPVPRPVRVLEASAATSDPSSAPARSRRPEADPRPAPLPAPTLRRAEIVRRRRAVRIRRRIVGTVLVVTVLAGLAAAAPSVIGRSVPMRSVTLAVDGQAVTITTRAATVGDLLTMQRVALRPGDRVVPRAGAPLRGETPIRVVRAFPVTIDVDGVVSRERTTYNSMIGVRRELGLASTLRVTNRPGRLDAGDTIVLRSPDDVTLVADGTTTSIPDTLEVNVAALLAARGVTLAAGDTVEPVPAARLTDGLTVTVRRAPPPAPKPVPAPAPAKVTSVAPRPPAPAPAPRPATPAPTPHPQPALPTPAAPVPFQTGSATWYGTGPGPGTCAHLWLPFGTVVTVTYQGRSARCRVADRGPAASTGRIIDLSPDVFSALAPLGTGVLRGITLSK